MWHVHDDLSRRSSWAKISELEWWKSESKEEPRSRRNRHLTPQSLAHLSSLLYGPHWQTALSHSLIQPSTNRRGTPIPGRVGVSISLVNRWVSGERPIPSWVEGEMVRLLKEREEEIRKAIVNLSSKGGIKY